MNSGDLPVPPEYHLDQEGHKMPVAEFIESATRFVSHIQPSETAKFAGAAYVFEQVNIASLTALRSILRVRVMDRAPYSYFTVLRMYYGLKQGRLVIIYKLEIADFEREDPQTHNRFYRMETSDILHFGPDQLVYVTDGSGNLIRIDVNEAKQMVEAYRLAIRILRAVGEVPAPFASNDALGDVKSVTMAFQEIDALIGNSDFLVYSIAQKRSSDPGGSYQHSVALSRYRIGEIPADYQFVADSASGCPLNCTSLEVHAGAIVGF